MSICREFHIWVNSWLSLQESMLRNLESNVEAEMANYGKQLDNAEVELKKVCSDMENSFFSISEGSLAPSNVM